MIAPKYEQHLLLLANNERPFKITLIPNSTISVCNWHKNIEILFFTEGTGHVQYDTQEFPVGPGDTVIINSNVMHCITSPKGIDYYCIIIDHVFCENNGFDVEKLVFIRKTRESSLRRAFDELLDEYKKAEFENSLVSTARLRRALLTLLIELCSSCIANTTEASAKQSHSEVLVKNAMTYINRNYTQTIRLDELAAALNVSTAHLAREFKRYTGQTIITYTNIIRCQKAAVCISNGMNITEAALECGFETLAYFSRTYKKLIGSPPSQLKA